MVRPFLFPKDTGKGEFVYESFVAADVRRRTPLTHHPTPHVGGYERFAPIWRSALRHLPGTSRTSPLRSRMSGRLFGLVQSRTHSWVLPSGPRRVTLTCERSEEASRVRASPWS